MNVHAIAPPRRDLARPCTLPSCSAASGQPCTTYRGEVWDRTHVDRTAPGSTGRLEALRPATSWDGRERRSLGSEGEIRVDECKGIALRLAAWLGNLPEGDARRVGVLAAIDVVRGQR